MGNMTKRIFLKARECQSLGWIMRSGKLTPILTLNQKFRMEEGIEIQQRARYLFPEGMLIDTKNVTLAAERTIQAMNDPDISVIFEGAFLSEELTARADILKREEDGWHLFEVKSSVNDKKEFIDDMAYTALVMSLCGHKMSAASLLLVNREFRLGMPNENLFTEIDHTQEVLEKVKKFESCWQSLEEITRTPVVPEPSLQYECRKCDLFRNCVGEGIDNHIFDIPRLSTSKFQELLTRGIIHIEDIPPDIPLTEPQERVKQCVQGECAFIERDLLKDALELIQWPVSYLDFETFMTALPLYQDTAPYARIPFQYSIHACSEGFGCVVHCEYLADPTRDCRRELAETLIRDLSGEGSILVYTSFEEGIIRGLADMFPDLGEELLSVVNRIIDLEKIIKSHVYYPEFHGRTSIKIVLPVLVPGMSYDELEIKEGDTAMATFAYMALGKYSPQEIEEIRKNLLKYCKHDTLAMVALHKELLKVM
jgi:CRISPR/Cas system-associated exonuclease Cas4 (RecB family)